MTRLNFLIDTNVLIAVDPLGESITEQLQQGAKFLRLLQEQQHSLFLHPRVEQDLARDSNADRRRIREALTGKYLMLPDPPPVTPEMLAHIGSTAPKPDGNSDVDNHHLAAVYGSAASWLVTEDQGIHRKAAALGIQDRVGTIEETVAYLLNLSPQAASPPLDVRSVKAHAIRLEDPIFDSLEEDYEFKAWFRAKCVPEHRDVLHITSDGGKYAGICVLKEEGSALKLCTLKVAEAHGGLRYGELLLRSAFERGRSRGMASCYLTVFPKRGRLMDLLNDFGFTHESTLPNGEHVMRKRLIPDLDRSALTALEHHITYGPGAIRCEPDHIYLVPLQPKWAQLLLPDAQRYQRQLFPQASAFSLRKAYLCHANVRTITPGATLLFYLSGGGASIPVVGVAEDTLLHRDPVLIASYVGKRTVYTLQQITDLCAEQPVLAIRFRQDRVLESPLTLDELRPFGVTSPPQSITTVRGEEASTWLNRRLAA